MNFLELDYINRVSGTLDRFRWAQRSKVAACRCPLCGDSQKSSRKTRGSIYFVQKFDIYCYNCYNCGASMSFVNFLKLYAPNLYSEYKLDKLKELSSSGITRGTPEPQPNVPIVEEIIVSPGHSRELQLLSELPSDHVSVVYCKSRLIPEKNFNRIYYTEHFAKAVVSLDAKQLNKKLPNDARIVFLMINEFGRIIGIQGRSLDPNAELRFVTIKFDDNEQKSFGLDTVNPDLPVFITEAIIDSLFLPNAVAIVGGDVSSSLLANFNSKVFIALDNEPRHKDTVNRMERAIKLGAMVCFWEIDTTMKDINDMVKGGISPRDVAKHIVDHSFQGPAALLKLSQWKRI